MLVPSEVPESQPTPLPVFKAARVSKLDIWQHNLTPRSVKDKKAEKRMEETREVLETVGSMIGLELPGVFDPQPFQSLMSEIAQNLTDTLNAENDGKVADVLRHTTSWKRNVQTLKRSFRTTEGVVRARLSVKGMNLDDFKKEKERSLLARFRDTPSVPPSKGSATLNEELGGTPQAKTEEGQAAFRQRFRQMPRAGVQDDHSLNRPLRDIPEAAFDNFKEADLDAPMLQRMHSAPVSTASIPPTPLSVLNQAHVNTLKTRARRAFVHDGESIYTHWRDEYAEAFKTSTLDIIHWLAGVNRSTNIYWLWHEGEYMKRPVLRFIATKLHEHKDRPLAASFFFPEINAYPKDTLVPTLAHMGLARVYPAFALLLERICVEKGDYCFGGTIASQMDDLFIDAWLTALKESAVKGRPLLVVLDSLDRCPKHEFAEILEAIKRCVAHLPICFILSSRREEYVEACLSSWSLRGNVREGVFKMKTKVELKVELKV